MANRPAPHVVNPVHTSGEQPTHSDLDLDGMDLSHLDAELQRLAAAQRELLAPAANPSTDEAEELVLLQLENAELRARVEELELLLKSTNRNEVLWEDRQREYEALLEEKSEVIRGLHLRLHELQERMGQEQKRVSAPAIDLSSIPNAEELLAMKEELEEQRRQIHEDEEALMTQMRQMELALSRDRAELARQRNELQRLQADLNHEIELASRDPGLRERLKNLRPNHDKKEAAAASNNASTPSSQQSSGIFRRIFG